MTARESAELFEPQPQVSDRSLTPMQSRQGLSLGQFAHRYSVFLESLLANSAYFALLAYAMDQSFQFGVLSLGIVAAACKVVTAIVGGLLTVLSLRFRKVQAVLCGSELVSLAVLAGYLSAPGLSNAVWSCLALLAVTATLQVFENNLRSDSIVSQPHGRGALSSKAYVRSTQGALVLAGLMYLSGTLLKISVHWLVVLCLILSLSSKLLRLTETTQASVPSIVRVSFSVGARSYLANPFAGEDLWVAVLFMGSNTITVYVLGLGSGSVALAMVLTGVSIWLSPVWKKAWPALMALAIMAIMVGLVITSAPWVVRVAWVFVVNVAYWTAFGGTMSKMYEVVGLDEKVEFTAFRNVVLITVAAAGELLSGILLDLVGMVTLVVVRIALALIVLLVAWRIKRAKI